MTAQSVLITGCNGGIGQHLVAEFRNAGFNTIGIDKTSASGPARDFHFIKTDIGDYAVQPAALESLAATVRELTADAPLTTLVNNAAVQILGHLETLTPDNFVHSMNVNLIAPFLLARTFLPELRTAKGAIINIGSVHASATKPRFTAYATSKAALHGLTRALAVELGPDIRVNTVAPAATATDMLKDGFADDAAGFSALESVHPLNRIAEPAEIARLALFLASENASFLTGTTLYADGGILARLHDPA